jgi:hypothetical protein
VQIQFQGRDRQGPLEVHAAGNQEVSSGLAILYQEFPQISLQVSEEIPGGLDNKIRKYRE